MQEMQETGTRSLGQKDPLEEETATHPVFLSGKFRGQRSLVGFATTGCKELDMTEHAYIENHTWLKLFSVIQREQGDPTGKVYK